MKDNKNNKKNNNMNNNMNNNKKKNFNKIFLNKINNLFKFLEKNKYSYYIIILIFSILISIPLFNKDINILRDDGIQHVCRLIENSKILEDGQFLPNIMSRLCNNFGYSWNIFYSPITGFVPLIFKIFNISFINIMKLFIFFVTFLSGVAMYQFVNKVTKNKNIALFSSLLYIFAPYRLTDMYVRNAIAELTSFIFIPIVFNGLYEIINKERKSYILALGASGLILTHTVIAMYLAVLCFIYVLVNIKKLKNKEVLKNLALNIILILLVSGFFLVGLLQHYNLGIYEVFVPGRMEDLDKLISLKPSFINLIKTSKDSVLVFEIGLINIIGLILIPFVIKKIPKENKKIYLLFLIFALVLTIMSLDIFPFEKLPSIFRMLQFTFRLYEFTAFFYAFIAGISFYFVIKNFNIKDVLILSLIQFLLLAPFLNKLEYGLSRKEEELLNGVKLTENTGRIHAGMASMEYLPTKAYKVKNTYIPNRKDEPIILNNNNNNNNNLIIKNYYKDGTNLNFILEINKELNIKENDEVLIELPYIYYLGYRINVNGKEIKYEESENGFILIRLNLNDIENIENINNNNLNILIEVKYLGTNEMIISFIISIITFLYLVIAEIIRMKKSKKDIVNKEI